jgi:hypothetical protein
MIIENSEFDQSAHLGMGNLTGMGNVKMPSPEDSKDVPIGGYIVAMLVDGSLVTELLDVEYKDAYIERFGEDMPDPVEFNAWKEEIIKS